MTKIQNPKTFLGSPPLLGCGIKMHDRRGWRKPQSKQAFAHYLGYIKVLIINFQGIDKRSV